MFPLPARVKPGWPRGSYQAIRVHFKGLRKVGAAAPGLGSEVFPRFISATSRFSLATLKDLGSAANNGPGGILFTTLWAVVHKRKRTKKKIRNPPQLWISRSPMTKLCKAVTAPPAYPQPVAVPYTSLEFKNALPEESRIANYSQVLLDEEAPGILRSAIFGAIAHLAE